MKKIKILYAMLMIIAVLSGCSPKKDEVTSVALIGEWQSEQGTLFTFDEEGNYGYYKDGSDRDDNYYKGPYTYQNGEDAMNELGITASEFEGLAKAQKIEQKDIYAVKMDMQTLVSGGSDKSEELKEDNYYYFAFYLLPDEKALAVNMSTFDKIELTRLK